MSRVLRLVASCGLVAAVALSGLAFGGAASASSAVPAQPSCMFSSPHAFQTVAKAAGAGVADAFSATCTGIQAYVTWYDQTKGYPSTTGFVELDFSIPFSGGFLYGVIEGGGVMADSETWNVVDNQTIVPQTFYIGGACVQSGSFGVCLDSTANPINGGSLTVPQFDFADSRGNSVGVMTAGLNGVPYVPPCTLVSVSGPGSYSASPLSYSFVVGSPVDSVAIIPYPTLVFTSAPSNWFASYALPGLNSPGTVNTFLESPMGTSFSFPVDLSDSDLPALVATGGTQQMAAWCFDGVSWYDWGELSTLAGGSGSGSGSGGSSFAACSASSGIGLDPVSWVPALVNMMGCAIQALFVPPQSSIQSLTNVFGITSNDPGGSVGAAAWLGSMVRIVASAPASEVAAIQTVADNGSCFANAPSAPSMSVDRHSIGVCAILSAPSSLTSNSMPGWITFIKDVLTVVIYGGAGLLLFGLLRKVLGGS